eukprot:scaffold13993_cov428-Alexandrium_tamarense.AAC.7
MKYQTDTSHLPTIESTMNQTMPTLTRISETTTPLPHTSPSVASASTGQDRAGHESSALSPPSPSPSMSVQREQQPPRQPEQQQPQAVQHELSHVAGCRIANDSHVDVVGSERSVPIGAQEAAVNNSSVSEKNIAACHRLSSSSSPNTSSSSTPIQTNTKDITCWRKGCPNNGRQCNDHIWNKPLCKTSTCRKFLQKDGYCCRHYTAMNATIASPSSVRASKRLVCGIIGERTSQEQDEIDVRERNDVAYGGSEHGILGDRDEQNDLANTQNVSLVLSLKQKQPIQQRSSASQAGGEGTSESRTQSKQCPSVAATLSAAGNLQPLSSLSSLSLMRENEDMLAHSATLNNEGDVLSRSTKEEEDDGDSKLPSPTLDASPSSLKMEDAHATSNNSVVSSTSTFAVSNNSKASRKEERNEEDDVARAIQESLKQQQIDKARSNDRRIAAPHGVAARLPAHEVIDLLDSDGDENDVKRPTYKREDNDRKMPAVKTEETDDNVQQQSADREEDEWDRILRLSEESARAEEEARTARIARPNYHDEDLPTEFANRILSRGEFEEYVNEFVARQGGFDRIESGSMVRAGNGNSDFQAQRRGIGHNQDRAQYGRMEIGSCFRAFDVLQGDAPLFLNDDNDTTIPDARQIMAFVDIGHGIGVQVLQAGLVLDIPSRGVEIMPERHAIAEILFSGVAEYYSDPPNISRIDMRCSDFSAAVKPDAEGSRDEEMRRFLLCQDLSEEEQAGLVIFINNAEDVFGARSNDSANQVPLDAHLAELFGNMKVGGRMLTLTDLTSYLERDSWYRRDVFELGTRAVTWSIQSVNCYMLTKTRDYWECSNPKCQSKAMGDDGRINVVDGSGKLQTICFICGDTTRPNTRKRGRRSPSKSEKAKRKK